MNAKAEIPNAIFREGEAMGKARLAIDVLLFNSVRHLTCLV